MTANTILFTFWPQSTYSYKYHLVSHQRLYNIRIHLCGTHDFHACLSLIQTLAQLSEILFVGFAVCFRLATELSRYIYVWARARTHTHTSFTYISISFCIFCDVGLFFTFVYIPHWIWFPEFVWRLWFWNELSILM